MSTFVIKINKIKMDDKILESARQFVEIQLKNTEPGHDYSHAMRVLQNVEKICLKEKCDVLIVRLAAILHDVADAKFHNGDEDKAIEIAKSFLESISVGNEIIEHVLFIIRHISYRKGIPPRMTPELAIVQDADRLDAIGAIGIARAFSYGGFMRRPLHDFDIIPNTEPSLKQPNTINHFYEKLLKIKDMMNTNTAKEIAEGRHEFLLLYLQHFYKEALGD